MGDAGALFLGVLLAVPTITIGGRTDFAFSGNTYFFFAPAADPGRHPRACRSSTRCSRSCGASSRASSWHQADAGHLHHRLMRLGHGPRRTVVILWAWTALLSGVALVPTYTNEGNALVPFVGGAARAGPVRAGSTRVSGRARERAGTGAATRPAVGRRRTAHGRRRPGASVAANGRERRPLAASELRYPSGNRFVDPLRFDSLQGVRHRLRIHSQARLGDAARSPNVRGPRGVSRRGLARWTSGPAGDVQGVRGRARACGRDGRDAAVVRPRSGCWLDGRSRDRSGASRSCSVCRRRRRRRACATTGTRRAWRRKRGKAVERQPTQP